MDYITVPFADLRMHKRKLGENIQYLGVFCLFIWRELFGTFEFVVGLERSPGWGRWPLGAARARDLSEGPCMAWGEVKTEVCRHLPAQVNQHLLTGIGRGEGGGPG